MVVQVVTFQDWSKIDEKERRNGAAEGRERRKFVSVHDMLEELHDSEREQQLN